MQRREPRRSLRTSLVGLLSLAALAATGLAVTTDATRAQTVNPGRDCQTITTCQFRKGGSYRGCLSSYSCRVCRYVASSCVIGGARKRCHRSVCTWG